MEKYLELLHDSGYLPEYSPPIPELPDFSVRPQQTEIIKTPYVGETEWMEFIEPDNLQESGVMDYDMEINFKMNFKPIHRYSRTDRFKYTFYQLLGIAGDVPLEIKKYIKQSLKSVRLSKAKIWNQIRFILKKNKWRKYYNRIPEIIKFCTGLAPIIQNTSLIINEFNIFHFKWDHGLSEKVNRIYFPNLRFIAFKLMEKHNIIYPYNVSNVRTVRKRKYLNSLFELF